MNLILVKNLFSSTIICFIYTFFPLKHFYENFIKTFLVFLFKYQTLSLFTQCIFKLANYTRVK